MTVGQMPTGWKVMQLGEVGRWGSGGTPKRGVAKYFGGDIPWVKSGDLDDGVVTVTRVEEYITSDGLRSSSAKLVDPGTLLIAMYGATIGKLGVPAMRCATNQAIAFCVPEPSIATTEYLFELLLQMRPELVALGKGGAQPNISQTVLKALEIPVPPLNVQATLVHALRQIRVSSASTTNHIETAASVIRRFRRAVLAAACSGRLTADWREVNDDDSSVDALIEDSRRQVIAASKRRTATDPWTEPDWLELPASWRWAPMRDLSLIKGGIQKQPKRAPKANGFPYLRVANVLRGRLDLREMHEFELFEGELDAYRLIPGDLLVVEGNGSPTEIGRAALWRGEIEDCVHQNHIIRVRCVAMLPEFAELYWNSPVGSREIASLAVTSAGLYSLSTKKIGAAPVPVAPIEEQREIVRRVTQLLQGANALTERIDAASKRVDRSSQAVLAKAFRGELIGSGGTS